MVGHRSYSESERLGSSLTGAGGESLGLCIRLETLVFLILGGAGNVVMESVPCK